MNRFYIVVLALSFLGACASEPAPPLTADNPASLSAPEATSRPLRYSHARRSYQEDSENVRSSGQTGRGAVSYAGTGTESNRPNAGHEDALSRIAHPSRRKGEWVITTNYEET
jgi:hypothetical protein